MPETQAKGSDVQNRVRQAQLQCQTALKHYQNGNLSSAIKALGSALDLDLSLQIDERVQRFASRLTGLPPTEAIFALTDLKNREALIVKAGKRRLRKNDSLQSQPLWIIGSATLLLVVLGIGALLVSGKLSLNMLNPAASHGEVELHHLADDPDQTYLIAAPVGTHSGDGWPVLVALHGKGQTGQDMVNILGEMTRNTGIMLIAPTFTAISEGTINNKDLTKASTILINMIEEVKADGMVNTKHYTHYLGQVFFGYAEGSPLISYAAQQGMDYSDAGYSKEGPIGVVLVNPVAPLYDAASYWLPPTYLLLYGDQSPQAGIAKDYHKRLKNQGAAVYMEAAVSTDATMTADLISMVARFVSDAYNPNLSSPATAIP